MANKYRGGVIKKAFTKETYEINLREEALALYKRVKEKWMNIK